MWFNQGSGTVSRVQELNCYRPRSRGDNMFGSVRVFVCMYVGMCVRALKSATLLKNIIECSSQGAFKMVGFSKWLLFRQVAPSRSITLLILKWYRSKSRSLLNQNMIVIKIIGADSELSRFARCPIQVNGAKFEMQNVHHSHSSQKMHKDLIPFY